MNLRIQKACTEDSEGSGFGLAGVSILFLLSKTDNKVALFCLASGA